MLMPDVDVLIGVFRRDDPHHEMLTGWLEAALADDETVALTPAVIAGYVRIVTNPRIFVTPTQTSEALDHIEVLRSNESVFDVGPGRRHWEIFADLCRVAAAKGSLVADAAHAATAIEHGATWVTLDRDFARFPGLDWRVPEAP